MSNKKHLSIDCTREELKIIIDMLFDSLYDYFTSMVPDKVCVLCYFTQDEKELTLLLGKDVVKKLKYYNYFKQQKIYLKLKQLYNSEKKEN